AARVLRV
ncbi:acylphosphatase, partial [Escherichia coli 95.0183]